jgi:hypothetical protein
LEYWRKAETMARGTARRMVTMKTVPIRIMVLGNFSQIIWVTGW